MRSVIWSDLARANLKAVAAYIDRFDPGAAERMSQRLIRAADSLSDFAERGRPAGNGMRELVTVRPYVIRYRVLPETVEIVRIRHMARSDV